MKWDYWLTAFVGTHCTARGLASSTIAAYHAELNHFRAWVEVRGEGKDPDAVTVTDVLDFVSYLRTERCLGDSAVNRIVVVIRGFYRAMVAMGHLASEWNPMTGFPLLRAQPKKLPVTLEAEEVERLIAAPDCGTILGQRDRAIILLLYGTGIRVSECAGLRERDVDLLDRTIRVTGKGGHDRVVPLNDRVVKGLRSYRAHRGPRDGDRPFFESRSGRGMSRGAIYQRVRTHRQRAGIGKRVSPHVLRHTFATHLVRAGVGLVTIRDLLGHRCLGSTQVYLHVTAWELREAVNTHPIGEMSDFIESLLPNVKLPLQRAPSKRDTG